MAVSFALSYNLLLKLEEGPAKVVVLAVDLTTFFFPFSSGLIPFPFPLIFLSCPIGAVLKLEDLGLFCCQIP